MLNIYIANDRNWSNHRSSVLQGQSRKRYFQSLRKDVEKANVREDSLIRGPLCGGAQ